MADAGYALADIRSQQGQREWRALCAERAVNAERMQHGLPGGGAARPLSSRFPRSPTPPPLSSLPLFGGAVPSRPAGLSDDAWAMMRAMWHATAPGGDVPAASAGAYNYDASKVSRWKVVKDDERALRDIPFRLAGPKEQPAEMVIDILQNGHVPGQARPAAVEDARGFLKINESHANNFYYRQIYSIDALDLFVRDGVATSQAAACSTRRLLAHGNDLPALEAAIQHWTRWVDALENFRASCHRRFTRVLAPALSLEAAEKDMTLFFKTVNIILINHHCTLLSSDGPAVFFDFYSDECEKLAELVSLDAYPYPKRTADKHQPKQLRLLRALHGVGPRGGSGGAGKAGAKKASGGGGSGGGGGGSSGGSGTSGGSGGGGGKDPSPAAACAVLLAKPAALQKASRSKLLQALGVPKCKVCGEWGHSKARCTARGGGLHVPKAPYRPRQAPPQRESKTSGGANSGRPNGQAAAAPPS